MNLEEINTFLKENPKSKQKPDSIVRWHPDKYSFIREYMDNVVIELKPKPTKTFIIKLFIDGYHNPQDLPTCDSCHNNIVKLSKEGNRFLDYCCNECSKLGMVERCKETIDERYDGVHFNATEEVKEKRENTCLKRYGKTSHMKTDEFIDRVTRKNFHSEEAIEKKTRTFQEKWGGNNIGEIYHAVDEGRKKTNLKRYGVENPTSAEEIKEKRRQTMKDRFGNTKFFKSDYGSKAKTDGMINKYGFDNYFKAPWFQEERRENNLNRIGVEHHLQNEVMLKTLADPEWCKDFIEEHGMNLFKMAEDSNSSFTTVTTYLDKHGIKDKKEKSNTYLESFVAKILDDNKIHYIRDYRLPNNTQLDFYIPQKKVAFELNGNYWHCSLYKSDNYHKEKYEEAKRTGIQLYQFFEDEVAFKPRVVKIAILHKCGLFNGKRVYARKCSVDKVDSLNFSNFLEDNHIQGSANCKYRYGLYQNNELVAVMGFSVGKRNLKEGQVDLVRFCTKEQVVGGFSKLLKAFLKDYGTCEVVSYSDLRVSNGNLYDANGFEFVKQVKPSYYYVDTRRAEFRYRKEKFQKKQMEKLFENFDWDFTERENAERNGLYQIFDVGLAKYSLKYEGEAEEDMFGMSN